MPEQKTLPDPQEIRRDLEHMTARWPELNTPARFEVRAFKEGAREQSILFDADWIDDAVEAIENLNGLGFNIYVTRNPLRHDLTRPATDADVIAAFTLWADCDDGASAGNVKRFDGPQYHSAVITGRTPETRVHIYWHLDRPVTDMAAWRDMQKRIATHFGSDKAVVNPSRIMRVAGTVAYPSDRKRQRGYIKEVATLSTKGADRPLVSLDQMGRVFGQTPASATPELTIDTFSATPVETYQDILRRAGTDGEKHTGVRDLTAKMAAAGVPRNMTEAMVREVCPVWDANVEDLIETAYQRFYKAPEQPLEVTPEERDAIAPATFKVWKSKDLSAIPRVQFAYSDFYAKGYTSLTLAAPKVGKSMLGLAEAMDMATGRGILTGVEREPMRVVYYNAEDDQNVIDARVAALLTQYGIDQSEIDGRFWPTSGVDHDDFFLVTGQDGIINEPLFVAIEKFIEDQNADVLIFDPLQDLSRSPETNEVFRLLGQRLRKLASKTNVALGLIHHTRKVAPGMTATIDDGRGGSALRGTARFNRILNLMTDEEAAKAGVENHRHYFRIGDMESNLAPPSAEVNRWFEKVSVETPSGEMIGAVAPWRWPDAFDGITPQQAAHVRAMIGGADTPPRADVRARSWVGEIVGDVLGINIADKGGKARVQALVSGWLKSDVLRLAEHKDARAGRVVQVVVPGDNDPLVSGDQGK